MLLASLLASLNIDPAIEGDKATFQWAIPEDDLGSSASAALEIDMTTVTFNVSERYDGEPHPAITGKAHLEGDSVTFAGDAEDAFAQFREAIGGMRRVSPE